MSKRRRILLGVPAAAQVLLILGKLAGVVPVSWFEALIPVILVFGIGFISLFVAFARYYASKKVL